MHDLDVEPSTDPGRLGFERDWDDLADAGVRLPKEQRWLWEEVVGLGEEIICITPRCIEQPTGYRMRNEPFITWDVETNDERKLWYPQLVAVRNDPQLWEAMADFHAVKRFPSLPGIVDGDEYGYTGWDHTEHPEPFRIWDLWPVNGLAAEDIRDVIVHFYEDSDTWRAVMDFLSADHGEIDLCEYAEYQGCGEAKEHVHNDMTGRQIAWEEQDDTHYYDCKTGMEELQRQCEDLTIDVDGSTYFRFPGDPEVPPGLVDAWQGLLESSRRNSSAAIGAFPPWERDEVLLIERAYNQWLWSY